MEEAVNRLRINISFLGGDVKKIMVVSSEPNEGKSFVALNLWKQMAVSGERSILVDLDMRKSTMLVKYQLEREDGKELRGTSHFLSGNDNIEDMILHTNLEFGDILPNVDNIVNPSMLLESRKFSEMMRYMEEHYRYVFVDVPPLGLVSDGELIGNACDGALLCVRGGVTSRTIVRRSIQQIERAGCQLLGIVLNRVGGSGSGYYHKYYGKKYYYNDKYYSEG
ncbi:MAG: CpsD/CapB family tyrosine-protein kinase [Firmicutes bacterium]|nr:CpsD/CapB family tyrosine-protein kinase [Bacillota bacterium]MBQ9060296.1 CpsD/CapB family tyrosine-protein kinase [Bacillota bacterium]